MKNVFMILVAGLLLTGVVTAQGPAACEECPTAKKVHALLDDWKVAREKAAQVSAEEQKSFGRQVAKVAAKCPVGSRMGDTLAAVKDVLGFVAASSAANARHCPLEKATELTDSCKAAKELKKARGYVVSKLHELAGHASGAVSGCGDASACCEGEAKTVARKGGCCEAQGACPIRLASRIGALKASFVEARREVGALTPAAKKELLVSFGELEKADGAITLVPRSVAALAEGFEALHGLDGKMQAWAKANPETMKELPESARLTFRVQVALIDEARGLLASVAETMKAMKSGMESAKAQVR